MNHHSVTTAFMMLAATTLTAAFATPAVAARDCVTKYAVATSSSEQQAKWYALETTVQAVSWGLWPGYVASGKVEGYHVSDSYRCHPDGGQVTCHVAASFCKK